MKLENIFQNEHAMAKKLCNEHEQSFKKNWDKKYGEEMKLKNLICDKTKKKKKSCDITLKLKV